MRFIANFTPYFGPKRCIYTVFCKVFTTFLSLAGFSSAPTSIFAHLHLNVLLFCTRDLVEKCHTLQSGLYLASHLAPYWLSIYSSARLPVLHPGCCSVGGTCLLVYQCTQTSWVLTFTIWWSAEFNNYISVLNIYQYGKYGCFRQDLGCACKKSKCAKPCQVHLSVHVY